MPGDVIAKIPRETTKTKDITGGLPRVAELFEVRKPKETAIISEINGVVSFGTHIKGKRKIVVTPEVGKPKEYLIPKGKHVAVQEGDFVRAGEPLMDGSANPHDILNISGLKELARYLVDEVQEVYRLQGVKINDKHIEVIVRQMLRRDQGDGTRRHRLPRRRTGGEVGLRGEERRAMAQGKRPAIGEPLLLGITKASLTTESLDLRRLLPGDHQGADRRRGAGQGGPSAGPQGKRHHGAAHPRGHRAPDDTGTLNIKLSRRKRKQAAAAAGGSG